MTAPTLTRPIMVVEDSNEDFEMLCWIFAKIGLEHPLVRCVTGDEALDYCNQHAAPLLILLDLNLPGTDGREVLSAIKTNPELRCTPVIVLTTSSNPRDVRQSYAAGANAYMLKPVNLNKLLADLKAFCDYWLKAVVLPETEETP